MNLHRWRAQAFRDRNETNSIAQGFVIRRNASAMP